MTSPGTRDDGMSSPSQRIRPVVRRGAPPSVETGSDACGDQAVRAALRQLFCALVAEGLMHRPAQRREPQDLQNGRRLYRLGDSRWMLEACGGWENIGLFQSFDELVAVSPAGERRSLQHPVDLLSVLAEAQVAPEGVLERLGGEMSDSIRNDAACRIFRDERDTRIGRALRRRSRSFWAWVTAGRCGRNHGLFLEQWSSVGHPYHVTKKSKQNLPLEEVRALSPEFGARVPLTLLAVRRERLHVEAAEGQDAYTHYMSRHFPSWIDRWRSALEDARLSVDDFFPVPTHPLQLRNILPRLALTPAGRDIFVPPDVDLNARPTSSFRTLVPLASPRLPHLKLAVGLRLTTVPRTISPRSCEMGPRIGVLLGDIGDKDRGVGDHLTVAPEIYGVHFASVGPADEDLENNIAAIVRQNPMRQVGAGEWLVPATAFSVAAPGSEKPLLVDILQTAGDDSLAAGRDFFRRYAGKLLAGLLKLYLGYGIALEAHQQNMFALLSDDGRIIRFVARDFGGIRIHRSTLEERGYRLKLHPDRLTVREDWIAVRRKLLTPAFHYHLGEIAATLGTWYRCGDRCFWRDLADVSAGVFDALRGEVDSTLWHAEREAVLTTDWDVKATLRMRLTESTDDIYVHCPNPMMSCRAAGP
jgi:D-ornithine---citrate ligase